MHRLWRAAINSWKGLRAAGSSETAFQQELAVFVVAIPVSFLLAADPWKRLALILSLVLLMIVELLNTSIEKLSDRVSLEHDPRIAFIKDVGSAAVGLSILFAGAVWLLALAERLGLI
jgi:diacylglycerol kinase (ATP)